MRSRAPTWFTALSKFQQYNQQRSNLDIEGLWHEAQVAAQLDRLGVARERLDQILELQPQNLAATLLLGQVEINLANYQNAESLFQEVLEVDPTNQVAQSGITQARIAQNKEQSEDPIRAALIESTRIREGTARDAGDPKRAIDYLETKFEELKFHPRIARELASLYLVFDDIASARSAIDRAIKANPDDETLAQLREALNADDSTDVGVTLIKGSDASERDKLLAINALYRRANRTADADLALDRLTEIAPEDPSVLDLRLVRALRDKNESEAVKITDIAERTDADQANGATFRARLEASRGKPEDAMALLERAIKSGAGLRGVPPARAVQDREQGPARRDRRLSAGPEHPPRRHREHPGVPEDAGHREPDPASPAACPGHGAVRAAEPRVHGHVAPPRGRRGRSGRRRLRD